MLGCSCSIARSRGLARHDQLAFVEGIVLDVVAQSIDTHDLEIPLNDFEILKYSHIQQSLGKYMYFVYRSP